MAVRHTKNYSEWPEDGKYRGHDIPLQLKQNWNNVSGRWWKQGVDAVLDSPGYESLVEQAWMYGELM